jgi:hypothetical protein
MIKLLIKYFFLKNSIQGLFRIFNLIFLVIIKLAEKWFSILINIKYNKKNKSGWHVQLLCQRVGGAHGLLIARVALLTYKNFLLACHWNHRDIFFLLGLYVVLVAGRFVASGSFFPPFSLHPSQIMLVIQNFRIVFFWFLIFFPRFFFVKFWFVYNFIIQSQIAICFFFLICPLFFGFFCPFIKLVFHFTLQ